MSARARDDVRVDTLIDHGVIYDGVVGNVGRIANNGGIAAARSFVRMKIPISYMTRVDENPVGCEPIIVVARSIPVGIAVVVSYIAKIDRKAHATTAYGRSASHEFSVGRHRHPTGVLPIGTPYHPGWAP